MAMLDVPRRAILHSWRSCWNAAMLPGAMLFSIAAPANNERGPRYMEKALAAVHQALRDTESFTLEYGSLDGAIGLFIRVADPHRARVTEPIIANYPHCTLRSVSDHSMSTALETWSAHVRLIPDLFPILRHAQFEDLLNGNFADPVSGILRAILPVGDQQCRIQITATPASGKQCRRALEKKMGLVHILEKPGRDG